MTENNSAGIRALIINATDPKNPSDVHTPKKDNTQAISVGGGPDEPDPLLSVPLSNITLDFSKLLQLVPIINIGGKTLIYSCVLTLLDNPGPIWASINKTSGIADDEITLSASLSGLTGPATLHAKLDISSNGGDATINIILIVAPSPVLGVSKTVINLGSTGTTDNFQVLNLAAGSSSFTWTATNQETSPVVEWLSQSPSSGVVDDIITITANRSGLAAGNYHAHVTVTSITAGSKTVDVYLQVLAAPPPTPQMLVSTTNLNFGVAITTLTFNITNIGTGTLNYNLSEAISWLSLSSLSGSLSSGLLTTITATADRTSLDSGTVSGNISITSNGGNATVSASITELSSIIEVSTNTLDFSSDLDSLPLTITNGGGGKLDLTISESQSWLTESNSSLSISASVPKTVTFTVNRGSLPTGHYSTNVSITSDGGNETILVEMDILVSPEGGGGAGQGGGFDQPVLGVSTNNVSLNYLNLSKVIQITNKGFGVLSYTASITLIDQATANWASINKSSGTAADEITLTATTAGTSGPATIHGFINVHSNGGNATINFALKLQSTPVLGVSKNIINFGTTNTVDSLQVLNLTIGTPSFTYTDSVVDVSPVVNWLTAVPRSGIAGDVITLTADRTGLSEGEYYAVLHITSPTAGSANVDVYMKVKFSPVSPPAATLNVSSTNLDFGLTLDVLTSTIQNIGGGTLNYTVSFSGLPWLAVGPLSGSLTTLQSQVLTFAINRSLLDTGVTTGTVHITTNGGNQDIHLTVRELDSVLGLSTTFLDFGSALNVLSLVVTNTGGGQLNANLIESLPWFTPQITSGAIPKGVSVPVNMFVDRTGLSPGVYTGIMAVNSDGGNQNVNISMTVLDTGGGGPDPTFTWGIGTNSISAPAFASMYSPTGSSAINETSRYVNSFGDAVSYTIFRRKLAGNKFTLIELKVAFDPLICTTFGTVTTDTGSIVPGIPATVLPDIKITVSNGKIYPILPNCSPWIVVPGQQGISYQLDLSAAKARNLADGASIVWPFYCSSDIAEVQPTNGDLAPLKQLFVANPETPFGLLPHSTLYTPPTASEVNVVINATFPYDGTHTWYNQNGDDNFYGGTTGFWDDWKWLFCGHYYTNPDSTDARNEILRIIPPVYRRGVRENHFFGFNGDNPLFIFHNQRPSLYSGYPSVNPPGSQPNTIYLLGRKITFSQSEVLIDGSDMKGLSAYFDGGHQWTTIDDQHLTLHQITEYARVTGSPWAWSEVLHYGELIKASCRESDPTILSQGFISSTRAIIGYFDIAYTCRKANPSYNVTPLTQMLGGWETFGFKNTNAAVSATIWTNTFGGPYLSHYGTPQPMFALGTGSSYAAKLYTSVDPNPADLPSPIPFAAIAKEDLKAIPNFLQFGLLIGDPKLVFLCLDAAQWYSTTGFSKLADPVGWPHATGYYGFKASPDPYNGSTVFDSRDIGELGKPGIGQQFALIYAAGLLTVYNYLNSGNTSLIDSFVDPVVVYDKATILKRANQIMSAGVPIGGGQGFAPYIKYFTAFAGLSVISPFTE